MIADRIIKRLREQDREKWRAEQKEMDMQRLLEAVERFGKRDENGQVSMAITQELLDFLTSDDSD